MMVLGGIGFTAPWLLLGLIALPILWLILRAIPPAPIRRRFPGVALLLGLQDDENETDRTPWWLLLLRMLALAGLIIGLAGPILNPPATTGGRDPLLVVLDSSWAGATRWPETMARLDQDLEQATRSGRPVALMRLSAPEPIQFQPARVWQRQLAGLSPAPWQPGATQIESTLGFLAQSDTRIETRWFSDGLTYEGQSDLLNALQARGPVSVVEAATPVAALAPVSFENGELRLEARFSRPAPTRPVTFLAHGTDPAGNAQILASAEAQLDGKTAQTALSLPSELRSRLTHFEIQGQRSAGSISLTDDSLQKREVALIAGRQGREGLELLSPLHYLERALSPSADLLSGTLTQILPANPDVVVLADIATLPPTDTEALTQWVEQGGMLLRFAGPQLAASDLSRAEEDPLMPVRLRAGGRSVGGAMSWGAPKTLAPFPEESPFKGLSIPEDVTVTSQVVAQPDPTLADRVIAALSDGTPLVTRKSLGDGQIVLFHVTANADWSNLPLSGLFVEMLERLAVAALSDLSASAELEGTTWTPLRIMDGFGTLRDAGILPGVTGDQVAQRQFGPDLPPGIYDNKERRLALNVIGPETELVPATWPAAIPIGGYGMRAEQSLSGEFLSAALLLLSLDILASLWLTGRLGMRRAPGAAIVVLAALASDPAQAQEDSFALNATAELTLAHVLTGDTTLDDTAQAGLVGLADVLFFRTSIEPGTPTGVDLERDELAFFPLLYWPISPAQPQPSEAAYAKLNAYLRSGGMILFDTRDADIAGFGAASPNGRKLQQLAEPLDIPALEPLPGDHVLTRTFYLLQDFPGRHNGRNIWVEASQADAEQIEGMPFRNLNDGVTPVVIGGNDWASAWATDGNGRALFPVGRGFAGERQRELAYRFGINLVMHVLTGNYKSDQVHVPALLDRLGQ